MKIKVDPNYNKDKVLLAIKTSESPVVLLYNINHNSKLSFYWLVTYCVIQVRLKRGLVICPRSQS